MESWPLIQWKFNRSFAEYYSNLYTSSCSPISAGIPNPLESLLCPKIDEATARGLGDPISTLEIQEAICSMENRKSPGPDGFTVKAYSTILAPVLARMYNDSLKEGHLPTTLSVASISLILKKDKDPTCCSSYRPVSLLNMDCKILAKVLSFRLQWVPPSIISLDQTGFMLGRQPFFNTRRLLNIIRLLYTSPCASVY